MKFAQLARILLHVPALLEDAYHVYEKVEAGQIDDPSLEAALSKLGHDLFALVVAAVKAKA